LKNNNLLQKKGMAKMKPNFSIMRPKNSALIRTLSLGLIIAAAIMVSIGTTYGTSWAQDPVPFQCTDEGFVVQDVNGVLNRVSLNGAASLTPILAPAGFEYNNIGHRSTDGLIYALKLQGNGYGDGVVSIVQIDATGNVVDLGLPGGLPTGIQTRFDAGAFSADGNTMFISFGARSDDPQATLGYHLKLYKLDLGSWAGPGNPLPNVTFVNITGDNAWVNDWAFGPGGLLYGGDQWGTSSTSNSQLSVLNPTTGVRTDYDVTGLGNTGPFGASWYDTIRGTIFIYENAGNIYEIDVSDLGGAGPSIDNTWTAPGSTRNDGTFCAGRPSIDIQKTVYEGWNSGGSAPGGEIVIGEVNSNITYVFTVTNTGATNLENITIDDTDLGIDETDLLLLSGTLPLNPGGVIVYYYQTTISGDLVPNEACATGTSPLGIVVDDCDTANVVARTVVDGGCNWGCTPGYWKNHIDSWVSYAPDDSFETIFGVTLNGNLKNLTLGEGLDLRGGDVKSLIRHAVAALLNSSSPDLFYNYATAEVIAKVQEAFNNGTYELIKEEFEAENQYCPLN
jgi:hypothetical protein